MWKRRGIDVNQEIWAAHCLVVRHCACHGCRNAICRFDISSRSTVSSTAAEPLVSADGKPLTFDVVSIREEKPVPDLRSPVQIESTPDGYRMKSVPLMAVIQIAYIPSQGTLHFGPNQIAGLPEALYSIRYDIEAKVSAADLPKWNDPALQTAMLSTMLQAMLADRFKLAVHRETKVVPIYEMIASGRGPKFRPSDGASLAEIRQKHPDARTLRGGAIVASGPNPGQQWLFGVTMPSLGDSLSTMAGRPVHDKTGLAGKYDLTYQLELPGAQQEGGGSAPPPDFFSSQILYVVQDQLGLKLSSAEGSMESLVIDHVERPSDN
jgi:bla regulator protein BlaR1